MPADTPPEAGPYITEAPPPEEKDGFPQVEDYVRARIADRPDGALTICLHIPDDESQS